MVYNHKFYSIQDVDEMARALPVEQRQKIIDAYNNGLGTVLEISKIFKVTERSVYGYLRQHRETGNLEPKPITGRPPVLTNENLTIIKKIVLSNIDSTLEEYREIFYKQTGIDVTIVTIFNACEILNLKRKKKVFLHRNRKDQM